MSKQRIKSQMARRKKLDNKDKNQNGPQARARKKERLKTQADLKPKAPAKKGGGQESKHGRKQKGNVDDT